MIDEIIRKKKKQIDELAPNAKIMGVGKKAADYAMESMAPEIEMEEEDDDKKDMKKKGKKSIFPEAKIEIELMIESAKKKK